MSDTTPETLNLRQTLAQIDRTQAETRKLLAEQGKLIAEGDKLRRDHFFAPILAAGALGGAIAAILPTILRAWGVHL